MDKKLLRKTHSEITAAMDDVDLRRMDEGICGNVLSLPEFQKAQNVFLYISVGREVCTQELVLKALEYGKNVYIPRCLGKGIMHAVRLNNMDELTDGMYGIPTAPENNHVISPEMLDMILVPGVCFDTSGQRLGRGGGYYDRYLSQNINACTVGVCRNAHLLENMQVDEHDRGVDVVVTQDRILRIK